MEKIYKKALINKVAKKENVKVNETEKIINSFIDEIKRSIYNNEKVVLHGLASFYKKERAAKKFYNISKKKICKSKKHNTAVCEISKTLKNI